MIDLQDRSHCPTLKEIAAYVNNPVFDEFCTQIKETYHSKEKIEFSSCSWEPGWNIKFKKAGKNLCTVYPRESFFTVLAVVGQKEKEAVESILPDCSAQLQETYRLTKEGNGQRWLMIDLENRDSLFQDALRLIEIRRGQ